jgi:hypothetical protein
MSALTITHSHADGTLIAGTAKGDGTAGILTARGWRWWRDRGTWYVPRSRDKDARRELIEATRVDLERAGHVVDVDVDDRRREFATVEADRLERMGERAATLAERAERADARAAAAWTSSDEADAKLPPLGQPILVGHHSEGRHRSVLERAETATRTAIAAEQAAAVATTHADVAAAAAGSRYSPRTVARRIARQEAELRRLQRELDGHTSPLDGIAVPPAQGAVRRVLVDQVATGVTRAYGRHNVTAGDRVKIRGRWYRVVRANAKTVTVPSQLGAWTDAAPWHEVTDHRAADPEEHTP